MARWFSSSAMSRTLVTTSRRRVASWVPAIVQSVGISNSRHELERLAGINIVVQSICRSRLARPLSCPGRQPQASASCPCEELQQTEAGDLQVEIALTRAQSLPPCRELPRRRKKGEDLVMIYSFGKPALDDAIENRPVLS
jgi:hypothetical protein